MKYWIRVDPKTGNPWPEGGVCWSYFPGDMPAFGYWIEVEFTGLSNKLPSELTQEEKNYSSEFQAKLDEVRADFLIDQKGSADEKA